MNQYWINRKSNKYCILFFNGWGMDTYTTNHLSANGYDICAFFNYNPVSQINISKNNYEKIFLVAWSLGVWVAAKALHETGIKIAKAIAINGTLSPIDETQGIPPNVFRSTLSSWGEKSREKFNRRMFGGTALHNRLKQHAPHRVVSDQKSELFNLHSEITLSPVLDFKFDHALVGKQDTIFPYDNQINFWSGKTHIVLSEIAHYPFSIFNNWNEILNL